MSDRIKDLFRQAIHVAQGDVSPATPVTVEGWIRTSRFSKRVTFLEITDGSTDEILQVVLSPPGSPELKARLGVGAAVRVKGRLVPSLGAGQDREVSCLDTDVEVVGDCDASAYPVQKKEASREFYRTIPHLRARTQELGAIFRARSKLSAGIHAFFGGRDFLWVHTPIITSSDCEGAGEVFEVATLHRDPSSMSIYPLLDSKAFFGRRAFLTVSGQLEVEPYALALGKVYTFGPTFRAEPSNTSRHASEFWMIEPEVAWASKDDVMALAEDLVRHCAATVGDRVLSPEPFGRVTYTRAMELLAESGRTFEHPVGWGESLQTEHERYLADEVFKGPVFVTDYPKEQKPFYMRLSDDDRTVECFDLLVPGVGEIIGGSAREERLSLLLRQMERCGVDPAAYDWYLDLRRYGSVPHGGFGLGLERVMMWLLDIPNIRDAIPYPRTPGQIV